MKIMMRAHKIIFCVYVRQGKLARHNQKVRKKIQVQKVRTKSKNKKTNNK